MVRKNDGIYYNVKKYHYASGIQIRLYAKPLVRGKERLEAEEQEEQEESEEEKEGKKKKSEDSSRNRTVQSIYAITRSNIWEWFITLTFDRNKVDSSDYDLVTKKAVNWLSNIKKRIAPGMKYILVPELHSDGEHWHIHGLLADCPELQFMKTDIVKSGKLIYNLSNWKYGFSTATAVEDTSRVSSYITKYITKELCLYSFGKRRYWASKNCLRANDVLEIDLLTEEEKQELLNNIADDIKYMKTEQCSQSGQIIHYIEV